MNSQDKRNYWVLSKTNVSESDTYQPNLSLKDPSGFQKVEILEEVILNGTLEDLKSVLRTYKTFEFLPRALGLAARYRGVDFVRELADYGATFQYESTDDLQKKYHMDFQTAGGIFKTEYYLMLVSLEFSSYYPLPLADDHKWHKIKPLPAAERIKVVEMLLEKDLGVSLDEMLFWALIKDELAFADALIKMGADLQKEPPSYWFQMCFRQLIGPTYLDIITGSTQSIYWTAYVAGLTELKANRLLPVLIRLQSLAAAAGKKLVITQKLFDELKWNDESLSFALENTDFSRVNRKKALEAAVINDEIASLAKMADAGWLAVPAKRESLISFAMENRKNDALSWLMDFKNRTADLAAEQAKEEIKIMRELMEKPNSVSALKKIWSYEKLDDGTLMITGYKGSAVEVEIPSMIENANVTIIGEYAFSRDTWGHSSRYSDKREKITHVTVPEGVTEIGKSAFYGCISLETVSLPESLEKIGEFAFQACSALKTISLPKGTEVISRSAFWDCRSLKDENGFAVVSGILVGYYGAEHSLRIPDGVRSVFSLYTGNNSEILSKIHEVELPESLEKIEESAFEKFKSLSALRIPSGVRIIGKNAFSGAGLSSVELNEGLEEIGAFAFQRTLLESVHIPRGVKSVGNKAFLDCNHLRDVYISSETEILGEDLFGVFPPAASFTRCVHTPAGSAAESYMQHCCNVFVVHDYDE